MARMLLAVLLLVLLSACAPIAQRGPSAGSAERGCPIPADGTQLFLNEAAGYCLAHPMGFVVEGTAGEQWISPAPGRAANVPPVPSLPWVSIAVAATANETLLAAAEEYMAAQGYTVEAASITLGGLPALMLDGLPGQEVERKVLAVNEGKLYVLTFAPAEPAAETFGRMVALYNTVVGSFTFVASE